MLSSPAGRPRAVVALAREPSPPSLVIFLLRGKKDRGDVLPLLLSPSADTTRNRSPMVEIDRYRPIVAGNGRNRSLPPDSSDDNRN
ncbi:hypothetical protein GW17_00031209 [Ensete ventricosum]|nr:hypothetical protein GW17_00031209 [Ensete ventricosum]